MAVRRWQVHPDETGTVSRQAMAEALMDGEALLARAGGVLSVLVQRAATDLPGEMVTVKAIVEWRDRTDAKPQPETTDELAPPPPVEPESAPELPASGGDLGPPVDAELMEGLPEEDESSVEAALA